MKNTKLILAKEGNRTFAWKRCRKTKTGIIGRYLGEILPALFLVVSMIGIGAGCAITSPTATTEQKAAEVKTLAYTAASIGTAIALEEKPATRVPFELAYAKLDQLITEKAITGLLLRDILNALPVKELKSPKARIAIDGAAYLYTATVGNQVNLETQPYMLAAATGIRDAWKAVLEKQKP